MIHAIVVPGGGGGRGWSGYENTAVDLLHLVSGNAGIPPLERAYRPMGGLFHHIVADNDMVEIRVRVSAVSAYVARPSHRSRGASGTEEAILYRDVVGRRMVGGLADKACFRWMRRPYYCATTTAT